MEKKDKKMKKDKKYEERQINEEGQINKEGQINQKGQLGGQKAERGRKFSFVFRSSIKMSFRLIMGLIRFDIQVTKLNPNQ